MSKLIVKHAVSEDARKAAFQEGKNILPYVETIFDPPVPPEVLKWGTLTNEGNVKLDFSLPQWAYMAYSLKRVDLPYCPVPGSPKEPELQRWRKDQPVRLFSKEINCTMAEVVAALSATELTAEQKDHNEKVDRLVQEYKNAVDELQRQDKEKREKEESERRRLHAKQREALKEWAMENGSELVKTRIAEGLNWVAEAHEEWALWELKKITGLPNLAADPWPHFTVSSTPCKNPDLEQMKTLSYTRQKFAHIEGAQTSLYWVTYQWEADEEEYPGSEQPDDVLRVELNVTLSRLAGHEENFWFLP